MRTFDEIQADINLAFKARDSATLRMLAQEMSALGTPQARAVSCNALGRACMENGEYAEALGHFQQRLLAHDEAHDVEQQAGAICNIGHAYYYLGRYDEALEQYRRALDLCDQTVNAVHKEKVITGMANVYVKVGDYPQAYESYQRALAHSEEIGDLREVATCTMGQASLHVRTGDYPSALERYRRALSIFESLGSRSDIAIVFSHLGYLYQQTRDSASAMEYLQRALQTFEDLNLAAYAANAQGNIGLVYADMGDFESALKYYHLDLSWNVSIGNHNESVRLMGDIISALLKLNRDDEAGALLDQQSALPMNEPDVRARHYANRATLAERSHDLVIAHEYLQQALETVTRTSLRSHVADYHEQLRDLAKRRNHFEDYIHHNDAFLRITEEVRGKETTQRLALMDAERKIEAELRERDKERALLYGALPESVATRMLKGEDVTGDHYDNAAVLFLDIVGFTAISEQLHPGQVVQFLEHVFSSLDEICKKHELTKIKTIGDSYMAVSFPSESSSSEQQTASVVERAAHAALEMLDTVSKPLTQYVQDLPNGLLEDLHEVLQVRIGLSVGAVTAGVLGKERLQYDVWGDTVNVASRMESTGEPGKIHVSEQFASLLTPIPHFVRNDNSSPLESDGGPVIPSRSPEHSEGGSEEPGTWHLAHRGETEVKGKGLMSTYWLEVP